MDLRAAARRVDLSQADRPGIGPDPQLLLGKRQFQSQPVPFGFFLAATDALAATHLLGKTAPLARFQAQRLQAQAMRVGQFAQRVLGLPARAVHAVQTAKLRWFKVGTADQRCQRPHLGVVIQAPGAQGPLAAQLPVVNRLHVLDQAGLEQQGAEFTRCFTPFDAAYLLRHAHLTWLAARGLKMRHHPAAYRHAFANVERQWSLAIKQVHARPLRDVSDPGVELGRQGGTALQEGLCLMAQGISAQLGLSQVEPGQHHVHIAHRPVPGLGLQAVPLHDGIEPMAAVLRVQQA